MPFSVPFSVQKWKPFIAPFSVQEQSLIRSRSAFWKFPILKLFWLAFDKSEVNCRFKGNNFVKTFKKWHFEHWTFTYVNAPFNRSFRNSISVPFSVPFRKFCRVPFSVQGKVNAVQNGVQLNGVQLNGVHSCSALDFALQIPCFLQIKIKLR